MLWCALLLLSHVAFGIHPKPLSSLQLEDKYVIPTWAPPTTTTTHAPVTSPKATSTPAPSRAPTLGAQIKAQIEQCVIQPFIHTQLACGNNPYAGFTRLAFHDCGTFDATNTSYPGGCNAWMTYKCTKYDQCEFTGHENNGLQMWVVPTDKMYDTATVNGKPLSSYLTRADFWHLCAHYAIRKSSNGNVDLTFSAGRVDPFLSAPGPRFTGRLPGAFAWSEMQRVAARNGMNDFSASVLVGAHTLGAAHKPASGYQGSWDPTPFVFDELYWKGLIDLKWFQTTVTSTNSETLQTVTNTQYTLGGVNSGQSLMLFADMGQHVANPPTCNPANGATQCTLNTNNPPGLMSAISAWANEPSTFYSAFVDAFEEMSTWGCSTCYQVPEYTQPISCPEKYTHTCECGYKEPYPKWVEGSYSFTTAAPTTQAPATTKGGWPSPTTHAPTTTTHAPTTTHSRYTHAPTTTNGGQPSRSPVTSSAPTTCPPTTSNGGQPSRSPVTSTSPVATTTPTPVETTTPIPVQTTPIPVVTTTSIPVQTTTPTPIETTPIPVQTTTPTPVQTTTPTPIETTTPIPVVTTTTPVATTTTCAPAPTTTTHAPTTTHRSYYYP